MSVDGDFACLIHNNNKCHICIGTYTGNALRVGTVYISPKSRKKKKKSEALKLENTNFQKLFLAVLQIQ